MRRLGRYHIVQKLGEGGMGIVYKATNRDTGEPVALKVLHPGCRADPMLRARFVREAKTYELLDHPGLAKLYEHGEVYLESGEKTLYMAMEFVPGRDLLQRSLVGFDQKTIVDIMTRVTEALAAAHGSGVIHRDLKPANIKMSSDGALKLLDFGLAKPSGLTATLGADDTPIFESQLGVMVGTAGYSAPEQLLGQPADARSDLFSLGVILYQLLTDRMPFRGTTAPEMLAEVDRDPTPVSAIAPGVAPGLERITHKLLARRPSERYQSAEELLVDLAALVERESGALEVPLLADAAALPSDQEGLCRVRSRIFLSLVVLALVSSGVLLLWLLG